MILNIILIVVIFLNLLLGVFVLFQNNRSLNNILFAITCVVASIWGFTNYMTGVSSSVAWLNSTYALGSLVMAIGLIWILVFTENKITKIKVCVILSIGIFLFINSFQVGFITETYNHTDLKNIHIGKYGWGLLIYTIFYIIGSFIILSKLYKNIKNDNQKVSKQSTYIFIGALISLSVTGINSFILPSFSIFLFGGIDNIGFLFFLLSITFSITKHDLFNIKLIAVEFMAIALWLIILIRTILAKNYSELFIESGILIITIVFSILLIKSIIREINHTHLLTSLNLNLEDRVKEQTKEITKTYEIERKARRDLEKLNETKDQFIMITQHNLRLPLTNIRVELNTLLSKNKEEIDPNIKRTLNNAHISANHLADIVDDFLNITTLKIGTQILKISSSNLKNILDDIIQELKLDIEKRNLNIIYLNNINWIDIKIDINKIKEALIIIFENAVFYNINNGKILISAEKIDNNFKLIIENTGMGINNEDKEKIVNKLFFRSKIALINNPIGMGIGLKVAKAIINGHHGTLKIDSAGENLGAKVEITLPINFLESL